VFAIETIKQLKHVLVPLDVLVIVHRIVAMGKPVLGPGINVINQEAAKLTGELL
jgi:hypothetical protein